MRRAFGWLVYGALVTSYGCGDPSTLEVRRLDNDDLIFKVDVQFARTAAERSRGLRGAAPLKRDQGLLIVLPTEAYVCVDSAGVDFAFDAMWIGADLSVQRVEPGIEPDSGVHCPPDAPVPPLQTQYVLEVADGVSAGAVLAGESYVVLP